MSRFVYRPKGVCSMEISFDISDENVVSDVKFKGGCGGNTQGVAALAEGMEANDLIERLQGIQCGFRGTSCPDQLAMAVKEATENK